MAKQRIDYETRFKIALQRIIAYDSPERLRRVCEKEYGCEFEEALQMAYENIQAEAAAALRGWRRTSTGAKKSVEIVAPST